MKKYLLSLIICLVAGVISVNAQITGKDYFRAGDLDQAKSIIEKELNQNPAEGYFFLGEIAYAKGDKATAKANYEKGLAADPLFALNQVGMAKVTLAANHEEGKKALEAIARDKANRKNGDVLAAIAKAYWVNDMTADGDRVALEVEKVDKNNIMIHLYRGDLYKKAGDVGKAANEYEVAIGKDTKNPLPYVKYAQVFMKVNPTFAIERLNEALSVDPNYSLAAKYLGRAYFNANRYNEAIEVYTKFFDINKSNADELIDYAASLYFTERYDEAAKLIEKGYQLAPNNFVLNRLRMYSALGSGDYQGGLAIADKFFAIPLEENSDYIARDYTTYGELLKNNDQTEKAVEQYKLAMAKDTANVELYKTVGDYINQAGKPAEAAEYYHKYITAKGEQAVAVDYFTLGQAYNNAATMASKEGQGEAAIAELVSKGDAAFAVVAERISDNRLGYLWRAKINTLIDPDVTKGSAKPYYEQALTIILAENDVTANRRDLIEINRYLSFYYFTQYETTKSSSDKEMSINFSKKMIELDPSNEMATNILSYLEKN